MAKIDYAFNSYIVSKYDNVTNDFPTNGIAISDVSLIGVSSNGTTDTTVQVTFASKQDIKDGNAIWLDYQTVTSGTSAVIVLDPAPNGVRLTGSDATAWVKGGA